MKKIIYIFNSFLLFIISILSLTSCLLFYDSDDTLANKKGKELALYIENKEIDNIYNLFSQEAKDNVINLKEQIEVACEFYCGNFKKIAASISGNTSTVYGEDVFKFLLIKARLTTSEKIYDFHIYWTFINKDNSYTVGIKYFYLANYVEDRKVMHSIDSFGAFVYE